MSEKETKRTFDATKSDNSIVKLSVRKATEKEKELAELEYGSVFNQCLRSGLPTQELLLLSLRDNGLINDSFEEEMTSLTGELKAIGVRLREDKYEDDDAKQADVNRLTEVQQRMDVISGALSSVLDQTANQRALNAQRDFLVACTVECVDGPKKGKRYWSSVSELNSEVDGFFVNRVNYEFQMFNNGLPSKWDEIVKNIKKQNEPEKTEEKTTEVTTPPAVEQPPAEQPKEETAAA